MSQDAKLFPLRRRKSGEWESRDGRFLFIDGVQAGAERGGGLDAWHIYDLHDDQPEDDREAWGDREPTLAAAADAVRRAEYPQEASR